MPSLEVSRSPLTETDAGKVELLRVPVGASGKLGAAYMHAHGIWEGSELARGRRTLCRCCNTSVTLGS